MSRASSFHALAGAALVACSVYDVPPLTGGPPSSEGGGGSSDGSGGKAPTTSAGTSNATGGSVTSGGAAVVMPSGGGGGGGAGGGRGGGAGAPDGAGGASDSSPEAGAGGVAEVPDTCPNDPDKSAPGVCGCGFPDVATATLASCTALTSKLIHRYDFEGSGTAVMDRVGTSHGVVVGGVLATLAGRGVVQLGGGSNGAYVDLPNGIVSSLSNATFEAWITWGGGTNYQRVFDFGDSDNAPPENNPKNGKTYLFASPKTGAGVVALGYSLTGNLDGQEQNVLGAAPLPQSLSQVVAVANATGDTLTLYVNGAQVGTGAWTGALASLNDVNVWLGRSQYSGDAELTATYHEFRVYGAALGATEIATAFKAGTDPEFMPK